MSAKTIVESVPAGSSVSVLEDWNFETPVQPGMIKLNMNATAVGLQATLTSLDQTIFQESPVAAGGTAGVVPSDNTINPIIEKVPAGRKLALRIRNTTGGAITFNGQIDFVPGGGSGGGTRRAAPRRRRK